MQKCYLLIQLLKKLTNCIIYMVRSGFSNDYKKHYYSVLIFVNLCLLENIFFINIVTIFLLVYLKFKF